MGINLFSIKWWVSTFVTVFITMIFIYIIKSVSTQYNIPLVKTVAQGV